MSWKLFGNKEVTPRPMPYDVKPEIARLVQAETKNNHWLSGRAEDGDLQNYETGLVGHIESTFRQMQTMPPKRTWKEAMLMFSGLSIVTITHSLKYTILLDYLGAHYGEFAKEKAFGLFQEFYSDRDNLKEGTNPYSLNTGYIKSVLLAPDAQSSEEETRLGIPVNSLGFFILTRAVESETARFSFEAKVWFEVMQQHMKATGVPEPNQYNQSFQWFLEGAKEQADEAWLASMNGAVKQ